MRPLLLLMVIASCERAGGAPTPPTTVVLFDELAERPVLELKPTAEFVPFHFGCKVGAVKDYTVIQCLDAGLLFRFRCADLRGPLEFVAKGEPMKVYCR